MDIVHLLPESVANQIAAGEVVQRPASVVKELVENSVDAGATKISVILKDAGRSVIQVIDNGKGMSPKDCEMAFARHATSKISQATDLFAIATFGFRGEALASIASVAQVELRSRQEGTEYGTQFFIAASLPQGSQAVAMPVGTNICVRDLFYNIPARRKFLKSENTELRNITQEFIRIALAHPEIEFHLSNNEKDLYNLPASILRKRIVSIFGKSIDSKLLGVKCDTGLITIEGFICTPNHAKKSHGEQFFFTNGRFMKHPAFHKAVVEAYGGLLPGEAIPSYFLYFTVNPGTIDVNIHPTKTEIKFQHEADCFTLIMASIKEVLGKFNIVDSIDFDHDGDLGYTQPSPEKIDSYSPGIRVNQGYNPFNKYSGTATGHRPSSIEPAYGDFNDKPTYKSDTKGWEQLFEGLKDEGTINEPTLELEPSPIEDNKPVHWAKCQGKYIIASTNMGLAIIDKRAAHIRVLYDKYLISISRNTSNSQSVMFPEVLELSTEDSLLLTEIMPDIEKLGFILSCVDENQFYIEAIPSELSDKNGIITVTQIIDNYKNGMQSGINERGKNKIALAMAQTAATKANDPLSDMECESLVYNLLNCEQSSFSPEGKKIITLLNDSDIANLFLD